VSGLGLDGDDIAFDAQIDQVRVDARQVEFDHELLTVVPSIGITDARAAAPLVLKTCRASRCGGRARRSEGGRQPRSGRCAPSVRCRTCGRWPLRPDRRGGRSGGASQRDHLQQGKHREQGDADDDNDHPERQVRPGGRGLWNGRRCGWWRRVGHGAYPVSEALRPTRGHPTRKPNAYPLILPACSARLTRGRAPFVTVRCSLRGLPTRAARETGRLRS
jgi:hypothetical protein